MKPTSTSIIEYRLARHDRRARGHRVFPITDYFFRRQTDATIGYSRLGRSGLSSRRAFRRMIATMMKKKSQPDRMESLVYGLVIVITAWPLVELIITFAQTANG